MPVDTEGLCVLTSVGNILNSAFSGQLKALRTTARATDAVQLQLATGLRVNSALDNPSNFFESQSLQARASDLTRLLDSIGTSIRTVQEASAGVEAITSLLEQGESIAQEAKTTIESGGTVGRNFEVTRDLRPAPLSTQILNGAPDAYYRLDEASGTTALNSSGVASVASATYSGGASPGGAPLYTNGGGTSAVFSGGAQRIRVPDNTLINTSTTPERTIELVFNADDTTGRQVLFEEGATVNGLTIYIDNGSVYVTGEDDQGGQQFADININAPIVAGQTYHVALVYNGPDQEFQGFLDGELIGEVTSLPTEGSFPSHSGDIGIGGVSGGVQFHDGENGAGNGFNFRGRISDVAIYNRALEQPELLAHAETLNAATITEIQNTNFETILSQIDAITIDANYRGVNLLANDDLTTYFSETRSSSLVTRGVDFSTNGLGIENVNFDDVDDLDDILDSLRNALTQVRSFGQKLATDLSIIETRNQFTLNTVNTLESSGDDLTVADQNELGAEFLALQTRQSLQITSLSLASESNASILSLF